jgi:hypothetical protein
MEHNFVVPRPARMHSYADPEALAAAAQHVTRDWGASCRVASVTGGPRGSVVLEVVAADGARFYVGSTRHANTTHADAFTQVFAWLVGKTEQEARP